MRRFPIYLSVALMLTIGSCARKKKQGAMPPLRVEVSTAEEKMLYNRIEVASSISSLYDVIIQPRVDGFLNSIHYSDGMPINKGDLLFTIDPDAYRISLLSAEATLEAAEAQEILARSNFERATPLARIDAISKSDLDQYTATYHAAIASTKSAREALNNAKLNLSYTLIYAPISGLVATTSANKGDYVGPTTEFSSLTTISYIDTVEVVVPIPTSTYLQYVSSSEGSFDNSSLLSHITLSLSGGVEYPFAGKYGYTAKDSPSSSSSVDVVVRFPNPRMQLKVGMFARVRARIGAQAKSVVVPQIAVSQTQGVSSLWVVGADSVVTFRRVKLGDTQGEDWIIEEGLTQGEMVLLSGQLKVHNGVKVSPQLR